MYEKTFKKDWDSLKDELEELGVKKPAHTKWVGPFKTRVASGIGAAMKKLDKLDPGTATGIKAKTINEYKTAAEELELAVTNEQKEIIKALDKIKDEDKAGYKTNTVYRGLKVFQAKLDEYVANAKSRIVEFQNEFDKTAGEAEKAIKAFKPKAKAEIANAVSAIKKVKMTPNIATYNPNVTEAANKLVLICSSGFTVCQWIDKGDLSGNWDQLRRNMSPFKNELMPFGTEEAQATEVGQKLDAFVNVVKAIGGLLEQM